MQFGDQIGDFVQVVANTREGRDQLYGEYHDWFGERWWMLPNPTYGSWEPALFNNDWAPAEGSPAPGQARGAGLRAMSGRAALQLGERERLIFALDAPGREQALAWVDRLGDAVSSTRSAWNCWPRATTSPCWTNWRAATSGSSST